MGSLPRNGFKYPRDVLNQCLPLASVKASSTPGYALAPRHPSEARNCRLPGSLFMSSLVFAQVVHVLRGEAVLKSRRAGCAVARYLGGGRREESCGWASGGRHDVLPLSIE